MATTKIEQETKPRPFEDSLARLDEVITTLERDNVPLDELMKLYEEGIGLLRSCNEQLDTAEQRVKLLRMSPDGTKMHLQDFDETAVAESEGAPVRKRRSAKKSAEETDI